MGMFDSVIAECQCGNEVEFQSKSGRCELDRHFPDEVPAEIAHDLHGTSQTCSKCGAVITLSNPQPRLVNMTVKIRKK